MCRDLYNNLIWGELWSLFAVVKKNVLFKSTTECNVLCFKAGTENTKNNILMMRKLRAPEQSLDGQV